MNRKKLISVTAFVATLLISAIAQGAMWLEQTAPGVFTPTDAPAAIDSNFEAVYFTENPTGVFNGFYDVYNNSQDYRLLSFGISNRDTIALIHSNGFTGDFGCFSSWCYGSSNLNEFNWGSEEIDFDGNTAMDVFGAIADVIDVGDNVFNFYMAEDGDLGPGDSWDGFVWQENTPSSSMFVVLYPDAQSGNAIYGFDLQASAVPLPAGIWLLLSGFVIVAARRSAERLA